LAYLHDGHDEVSQDRTAGTGTGIAIVARMKRSGIRGCTALTGAITRAYFPDYASLHPGYMIAFP